MINGFPIAQIPISPAVLDGGRGVAETGSVAGRSFEGLLGCILADNDPAQQVNNFGTDATSSTFRLSSGLINALHASGLITQKASPTTVENSYISDISELLGKALSFLDQISESKYAPVEVIFDLENADLKGIGLPGALGELISDGSALVLVRESDLKALLNASGGNGGEISLPVLALFKGGENEAESFSFMAATLTLRPQETDSSSGQSGARGTNKLQYFLTFMAPSGQPHSLDQDSRPGEPNTEFQTLAAMVSELLRLLTRFGTEDLSGNQPQESQGSNRPISPSGESFSAKAESNNINSTLVNQPETLAESATALLEAVKAFLNKPEGNLPAENAQTELSTPDATDEADEVVEKKTLVILANILEQAVNQAVQNSDPERFKEIISLFGKLSRIETLTTEEQKAALHSLGKQIKSFITQLGLQVNAGLDTLKTENASPKETTTLSQNGWEPSGSEVNGCSVHIGQAGNGFAVNNQINSEIFSENGNILQASPHQSDQQCDSVLNAADGSEGKTLEVLSEAAGKISSLLSSVFKNYQNSTAAAVADAKSSQSMVTVQSEPQASGGGVQSPILSAAVFNADQEPGQPSLFKNGITEGISYKLGEILQHSKASSAKQEAPTGPVSAQKTDGIRFTGFETLNSKDTGGAVDRAAAVDAAVKTSGLLANITVPVKLAGGKPDRLLRNSAQKYNASVEYVKFSANAAGLTDKTQASVLAGLKEMIGEGSTEEMLETLLGKAANSDELPARLERGEVSDKVKADQLLSSFRTGLSSLRAQARKADHAQSLRPNRPVNQAEVFEKIVSAARLTRLGGTSEISMRLEPDHLGQMRVRLTLDENHALTARIQVETQEARSLIEGSLHRLKDSLVEQGLKVEKFNVDVRQDSNQQQSQTFTETNREGGWRSHGGMRTEGRGSAFSTANNDLKDTPEDSRITVNKYSYSTLEWVA